MEVNRLDIAQRFFESSKMLLQGASYSQSPLSRDKIYLPQVYIVDGKLFWMLNAAKRAAYNYHSKVDSMDVNEAFMLIHGRRMSIQEQTQIEWNINQKGEDYNGFLFVDNEYITTANYNPYE